MKVDMAALAALTLEWVEAELREATAIMLGRRAHVSNEERASFEAGFRDGYIKGAAKTRLHVVTANSAGTVELLQVAQKFVDLCEAGGQIQALLSAIPAELREPLKELCELAQTSISRYGKRKADRRLKGS